MSRARPRWLVYVACLLTWITLLRASLTQYLVTPDSLWSLARIGLAFAVFTLVAAYAIDLLGGRIRCVPACLILAGHVVVIALWRDAAGAAHAATIAGALSGLAGGLAGVVIALGVITTAAPPPPGGLR